MINDAEIAYYKLVWRIMNSLLTEGPLFLELDSKMKLGDKLT